MTDWMRAFALAIVFALVGAFAASLWMEVRRETPAAQKLVGGEWEGRRIRVEVLNGAGVSGVAFKATETLRALGFDVVYYGNLEGFGYDSSEAIARLTTVEPARRVADALGIQHVSRQPDENLYLDVTVVLGTDWSGRLEASELEQGGGKSRWWERTKRAAGRLWPG